MAVMLNIADNDLMSLEKSYDKILYVAPFLYITYGLSKSFLMGTPDIIFPHIVVFVVQMTFSLVVNKTEILGKVLNISRALIFFYAVTHINEQYIAFIHHYMPLDIVSIGILSIAITYTFWMKSFYANIIIQIIAMVSFYTAVFMSTNLLYPTYIVMAFTLLAIWKLTNDFFIKKYYIAFEKFNKLAAYKETIGLLNHEFNNVNSLALLLIKRRAKDNKLTENEVEFEKVLKRVSGLIKDLNNIEDYETEEYTQGVEITKINNQNQSPS